MSKSDQILDKIYAETLAAANSSLHSGNYTGIFENISFILMFNKSKNSKLPYFSHQVLDELIELSKQNKCHGFSSGTMGVVFLLIKSYELTRDAKFLREATSTSYTFTEYLSANLDLNNGISGSLLGYLYLHSVIKEDWALEDLNIYMNYLIDKLVKTNNGFCFDRRQVKLTLCTELNVCFIFIKLAKYLNNKTFLHISVDLYNSECKKYLELKEHLDRNLFWKSWHFSFGAISIILYDVLGEEKYLTNFDKVTSLLIQKNQTHEDQIHLLYFLRSWEILTSRITPRRSYQKVITQVEKQGVWTSCPALYGSLMLAHYDALTFDRFNQVIPAIAGKLPAPKKDFPLFKNVLNISMQSFQKKIYSEGISAK